MSSAPVAPSLPLPTRATLLRPVGGDAPPAPGGPSGDFAEVLEASSPPLGETGGPAREPEPPAPAPAHSEPQDDADMPPPEAAEAVQDLPQGVIGHEIHAPEQVVLPLRTGSLMPVPNVEMPLPESQATGARSVTTRETGDPGILRPPAGPSLASRPGPATPPLPGTAPDIVAGLGAALARPGPADTPNPATAPDAQATEGSPGASGKTAADTRPDMARIPFAPQAPAQGLRPQNAPMKTDALAVSADPGPEQEPDRQALATPRTSDAARPGLAEAAAALQTPAPDPEVTTRHFDLRGIDAVASRPASQGPLLPPDLPRHMAIQLATAARSGQPDRPVQVLLNPAELGHVRITLHAGDGRVNVTVIAERPETLDLMRRHIETLAQEFHRIGYRAAEFSFGGGPSAGSGHNALGRRRPREAEGPLPDAVAPDAIPNRAVHMITDRLDLRL